MLRSQRDELCQLTSCCPSAPYLLFYALPCELELSSINIVPLPAGTVVGCVNKGTGGTLLGKAEEETSPFPV